MFKKQLAYSFCWLILVATFVWLVLATHSPADVTALQNLEYHEDGQFKHFQVQLVSQNTFLLIRWVGLAAIILSIGLLALSLRGKFKAVTSSVLRAIKQFRSTFYAEIRQTSSSEKIILALTFLLLLVERSYYVFRYPIHSDEAASYLFFIKNGFWATTTYYPIPNNHILQNLLALPLSWLIKDPFWVLRLPPLILSFLVSIVAYLGLKKYTDFTTAYLATAFFNFASFTLFLSTQGRGYVLLLLFTVLATFFLIEALRNNRAGFWLGFCICCTLGFYTVPVFLYPFGGFLLITAIVSIRKPKRILRLAIATLTTLAATAILYLPIGLVSGWTALFNNRYIHPLPPEQFWNKMPSYAKGLQDLLVGLKDSNGFYLFLGSILAIATLLLSSKIAKLKKVLPSVFPLLTGLCLAVNISTIALIFKQSILPPPRTLFFKGFFDFILVALMLAIPIKLLLKNELIRNGALFIGLLVFAWFQTREAERFIKDYPTPYYNFPTLNAQILESGAEQVYVTEQFYQLFLKYEYARARKEIKINTQKPEAKKIYDYVVIPKEAVWPEVLDSAVYKPVYQDEVVKAFKSIKNW